MSTRASQAKSPLHTSTMPKTHKAQEFPMSKMRTLKTVQTRCHPRARAGFSLLELTLVVAIMGVLIAVVAFNVTGQGNKAKARATQVSMSTLKTAIQQYNLDFSSYPTDLSALVSSKMIEAGKNKDGWNRDFFYDSRGRSEEQPFLLSSPGPDGIQGNTDDLSVWDTKLN
jgi:general secretion pathway protein G